MRILHPAHAALAPSSMRQTGPAGPPYVDPAAEGKQGAAGSEPGPGVGPAGPPNPVNVPPMRYDEPGAFAGWAQLPDDAPPAGGGGWRQL